MALAITPTLTLDTRKLGKLSDFTVPKDRFKYACSYSNSKLAQDLKDVSQGGTRGTLSFPRRPNCVRLGFPSTTPGVYHRTVSRIGDRACA